MKTRVVQPKHVYRDISWDRLCSAIYTVTLLTDVVSAATAVASAVATPAALLLLLLPLYGCCYATSAGRATRAVLQRRST